MPTDNPNRGELWRNKKNKRVAEIKQVFESANRGWWVTYQYTVAHGRTRQWVQVTLIRFMKGHWEKVTPDA
jgi:hypothetical protein